MCLLLLPITRLRPPRTSRGSAVARLVRRRTCRKMLLPKRGPFDSTPASATGGAGARLQGLFGQGGEGANGKAGANKNKGPGHGRNGSTRG